MQWSDWSSDVCSSDLVQKGVESMVTIDFNSPVFIPSGMSFTVGDFNSAGVRALGKAYVNSRDELILVDKNDIASFLQMKKSGLFSCLVSRLISVP
jgi:hypothetical protein